MTRGVLALALCLGCGAAAPAPRTAESIVRAQPDLRELIDARTGKSADPEAFMAVLRTKRVVYVGERHDQPADHAVQYAILRELHRAQPSIAIGMEMFQVPFQEPLDRWSDGHIDEAVLRRDTEYDERWGFDFSMYRPILEYARSRSLPVIALNARREVVFAVAQGGIDSLDPEIADGLPELDFDDAEHRAMFDAEFDVGEHGAGDTVDQYYEAQVIWDETMGSRIAATLDADGGPAAMIVFAGRVHVKDGLGVPARAAKRGAVPFVVVLPVTAVELKEQLSRPVEQRSADFFWRVSP